MNSITIDLKGDLPDAASDHERMRKVFVAGLYQSGDITLAEGARLLGIDRQQFHVDVLNKLHIAVYDERDWQDEKGRIDRFEALINDQPIDDRC